MLKRINIKRIMASLETNNKTVVALLIKIIFKN